MQNNKFVKSVTLLITLTLLSSCGGNPTLQPVSNDSSNFFLKVTGNCKADKNGLLCAEQRM